MTIRRKIAAALLFAMTATVAFAAPSSAHEASPTFGTDRTAAAPSVTLAVSETGVAEGVIVRWPMLTPQHESAPLGHSGSGDHHDVASYHVDVDDDAAIASPTPGAGIAAGADYDGGSADTHDIACDALGSAPSGTANAVDPCTFVTNAQLVAAHASVSSAADLFDPDISPTFYFRVTVVDDDTPANSLNSRIAAFTFDGTVGDGGMDAVENDSPADSVNVIRDYGLENAPIIIGVIGAIFLVGLTFYLVRRGLMKARGAMRL